MKRDGDNLFFLVIAAIGGFTMGVVLSVMGIFIAGLATYFFIGIIFIIFKQLKRASVKRHVMKLDRELKEYENN